MAIRCSSAFKSKGKLAISSEFAMEVHKILLNIVETVTQSDWIGSSHPTPASAFVKQTFNKCFCICDDEI